MLPIYQPTMLIYIIIFIIGTAIGSFLNVVILRLPQEKSIVKERSSCMDCKTKLKPYDMIPIVSFFVLRGKCRSCREKISWQYPLIEFVTGLLFVFVAYYYHLGTTLVDPFAIRDLVFVCALIVIFVTDLKHFLIFDAVTIPLAIFAFGFNLYLYATSSNFWMICLYLIIAMVVGAGFFYLQYFLSKGKWIGFGDVKMGLMMGAMLSWPKILAALFVAYIVGALYGIIILILRKGKMKTQVPFGVFLSLATLITLFYGGQLLNWYLSYLNF
jgi:leader peptidase (prepilin peptidase) / N-methyltransferase